VKVSARVENSGEHRTTLTTNGISQSIAIPPKTSGSGSSASGGELLFLALATCYCNDIYREAARQGVTVEQVDVEVEGQFGAAGEPASQVTYRAKVVADVPEAAIRELMRHTDTVSEIQNTVRVATPVTLDQIEAVSTRP
jgi:uncharacterized OsmC-like protein